MTDIQCGHHKGEGYHYELSKEVTLWLCNACNLNLASKVMGQVAVSTFAHDLSDELCKKEGVDDSNDDFEDTSVSYRSISLEGA